MSQVNLSNNAKGVGMSKDWRTDTLYCLLFGFSAVLFVGEHDSFIEKSDLERKFWTGLLAPVDTSHSSHLEGNQHCRALSVTPLHLQWLNFSSTQTAADKLEGGQGEGNRKRGRSCLREGGQRGEKTVAESSILFDSGWFSHVWWKWVQQIEMFGP